MKNEVTYKKGMASWSVIVFLGIAFLSQLAFAQKAGSAQQIAVAKTLKAGLTTIGILSTTIDDKEIEKWTRAGMTLGVKVVIGKARVSMDVAGLYRTLVKDKGAQVIIIPDASDDVMTGVGFEFLRETAITDQVGVFAPTEALVANGALCCVTSEGGKLKAFVNQKIAAVLGANVPSDPGTSVTYVVK